MSKSNDGSPGSMPGSDDRMQAPLDGASPAPYGLLWPPQQADEVGRIDRFRVLKLVRTTGDALVFVAEDSVLNRRVTLNVMKPELAPAPERTGAFLGAARALARVRHENVSIVHWADTVQGIPYVVTAWLDARSLHEWAKDRTLGEQEVIQIGRQVAAGLAALHQQHVLFGGLSDAHVWIEVDSRLVVLPHCSLTAGVETLKEAKTILGTPAYMSPESVLGRPLGFPHDLFGLGWLLYRLLTGEGPFRCATMFDLVEAIVRDPAWPLRVLRPNTPGALSDLIDQLLAKRPEDRPTARAAAERLEACLA